MLEMVGPNGGYDIMTMIRGIGRRILHRAQYRPSQGRGGASIRHPLSPPDIAVWTPSDAGLSRRRSGRHHPRAGTHPKKTRPRRRRTTSTKYRQRPWLRKKPRDGPRKTRHNEKGGRRGLRGGGGIRAVRARLWVRREDNATTDCAPPYRRELPEEAPVPPDRSRAHRASRDLERPSSSSPPAAGGNAITSLPLAKVGSPAQRPDLRHRDNRGIYLHNLSAFARRPSADVIYEWDVDRYLGRILGRNPSTMSKGLGQCQGQCQGRRIECWVLVARLERHVLLPRRGHHGSEEDSRDDNGDNSGMDPRPRWVEKSRGGEPRHPSVAGPGASSLLPPRSGPQHRDIEEYTQHPRLRSLSSLADIIYDFAATGSEGANRPQSTSDMASFDPSLCPHLRDLHSGEEARR